MKMARNTQVLLSFRSAPGYGRNANIDAECVWSDLHEIDEPELACLVTMVFRGTTYALPLRMRPFPLAL